MNADRFRGFACGVCCLLAAASGCRDHGDRSAGFDVDRQTTAISAPSGLPIDGEVYRSLDVQANTFTASRQDAVALDHDSAGNVVVVWHSRRQEGGTYGIFARRFDSRGQPLTEEVHVNAFTLGMQTHPVVAIDPLGGVWFAWESFGQDGDQGAVMARKFSADLSTATPEIPVNDDAEGHQSRVSVAATPDGGAIAAWTCVRDPGGATRIYARRFAADTHPIGPPFRVDTGDDHHDRVPCIAATPDGGFIVVWARTNLDGDPIAIMGRRFDPHGAPRTEPVRISDLDGLMHIEPALAANNAGQVRVAWMTLVGDEYVIDVRPLDDSGRPAGPIHRIHAPVFGHVSGMNVAPCGDEHYLVAWSAYDADANEADVLARLYDFEGHPASDVFAVTATTKGDQRLNTAGGARRVACLGDGRMAFAWAGFSGGDDTSAANLTMRWPEGDELRKTATLRSVAPTGQFDAVDSAAAPYVPPTYDPDRIGADRAAAIAAGAAERVEYGFLGVTATGWVPPDPHLAVGPDHLVLIVNGKIAFLTKGGVLTFQDQLERVGSDPGFWGEVGVTEFVFDPEVIYDPHSGRFMAIANERTDPTGGTTGESMMLLAVSDDADPNGAWHKYRFDMTPLADGSGGIDSPNIGVDANVVYLSADFLSFGHVVLMLDKQELLVGGPATIHHVAIPGTTLPSYGLPVTYGDAPAFYMIEADKSPLQATSVKIHALSDPLGEPVIETIAVATEPYRRPEQPPQKGTTARIWTFDARFWSCVYRNGSLWATHHISGSGGSSDDRVLQRWYQIDLNGWPAVADAVPQVAQWGDIDPGGLNRTYFGAIAVDAMDNMGIVFSQSSPIEYISIGRTGRLATDPPGTTRPILTVQSSTTPETSSPPRWGDYGGIVVDPVDETTFWYHHQFRTVSWRTWVGTFGYADTEPPEIVAADPFDGFIDPRAESSDGTSLDLGIDRLTITFSQRVVAAGGVPLDATAFSVSVTGGVNPGIRAVNTLANPTVEILLRGPIPVQQFSSIEADVADLSGNAAFCSVRYGFLPGDINQDGLVSPSDLIRFRQLLSGTAEPAEGDVGLYLDTNRDGRIVPLDLIWFRQLPAGTGHATKAWAGEALP